MTFTFKALLCVGLTLGLRTLVLKGTSSKPILRIQPDSVVSEQTTVTFLCIGTVEAKEYRLYKEVYQRPTHAMIPQNLKNQAEFSISKVYRQHAGQYCCRYWTYDRWSEYSNSLELVVTGVYSKPSLSALPSPVVTEGGNVILQCASSQQYHRLLLTNKGSQKQIFTKDPQYNYSTGQFQAQFSVGPVISSQRWTFICYSYHNYSPQVWSKPSEPLELLVSGTLHKPTIKAEPGSIVASGILMTIWCQGTLDAEIYVLQKEGSQKPLDMQIPEKPENKTKFPIPSVTHLHAGQYQCYCYSSAGWTESSDTLELVVTGIYNSKPRLSALPSPVVISGGNTTLQCVSGKRYDKFILTKEDQKFLSSMDSQYIPHIMQCQALFSIDHVTPNLTGTFRCYGYYKQTPQLWSVPSDPLEIHISGTIGASTPPPSRPMTTDARRETELQLPAGIAMLTTRNGGPQKRSNPAAATQEESLYASVEDMKPKDGVELDISRPPEEDPLGETYAQVKPSRHRRAEVVLLSVLSREVLERKDGNKTEEGREMDTQDAESEEPQDVVYAQLCSRSLRQGTAVPPHSQAGEAKEELSVYAALAVTRPGSVPDNKEQ